MTALHPPRREKNGRRQRDSRTADRQNEINRRHAEKEMSVVKAQPHRNGSDDPLLESAIGRFVRQYAMEQEIYDAALHYALIKGLYRATIGAPRDEHHGGGGGGEIDKATETRWKQDSKDWRRSMVDAGGEDAAKVVDMMALDHKDPPLSFDRLAVMSALRALGIATGKMAPRRY
jgi:hypothetical protein